jgi:hypothetical protein
MRGNLVRLAEDTGRPLVVLLQEAGRGEGWTIPGYNEFSAPASAGPDHDMNRVLVRTDARVLDDGWVQPEGDGWVWNGNDRAVRTYPWVAILHDGGVHVFVSVHRIPLGPRPGNLKNRAAWAAEHRALVRLSDELSSRWPGATVTLGGDWNAGLAELPSYQFSMRSLMEDVKASDAGVLGIDGYVVVNGAVVEVRKLADKYGSDGHRPVVAVVEGPA